MLPTLPLPLPGSTGGDGARHAARPSPGGPLPAHALRGVGIATVATVAVTGGAFALSGAATGGTSVAPPGAELARDVQAAALVPSPVAAVVPAPVTALVAPDAAPTTTAVLDTGLLSDAVARAQDEARRLADEARAAKTAARDAEERARQASDEANEAEEAAEDDGRGTAERAGRIGRLDEPKPAPAASTDCGLDTGQLGAVKPFVRTAAQFLGCTFGEPTVLGVAGRSGASDHPSGRALDFMVDRVTGDRLAACAIRNREELGISYVIWRQRIDTGSGFRAMPDRGGATANHFDHVHVSFKAGARIAKPLSC